MSPSEEDKVSIVVCDDQPAVAEGLARVLHEERQNFSVVGVATDARQAEEFVRETLPDIVIMDIYMPDQDGIEATRRIRTVSPSTNVVILTVSDSEEDLYRAVKAGALGYVTKDKDPSVIAEVVMSVFHRNYALPAHLAGRMLEDLDRKDATDYLGDEERTILAEIAAGHTDQQIAERLHLSERTIRRRIRNIYEKLQLADRIEAALFAVQKGLTARDDASSTRPEEEL